MAMQVLTQIGSLLQTGEEQKFKAFGSSRGFQAELKDGAITSWQLWGKGSTMACIYPEPVSPIRAALSIVKSLVDEMEDDPDYEEHTMELYRFINSPEGQLIIGDKDDGEFNE